MNISDFKAANPDYADVPDLELADALHQKFYSDVPRADFLQKVGMADAGGDLSTGMPRDAYAKRFMADNPQAKPEALNAVLAQYDQQQAERAKAPHDPVQDRFKQMESSDALFNARLSERLQARNKGIVQVQPGYQPHVQRQTPAQRLRDELAYELAVEKGEHPDLLPPSTVNPQDYTDMMKPRAGSPGTVLANAATGLWGTAMGIEAAGASMLGRDDLAAGLDAARARGAEAAHLNGGDTIVGKASNLAGAIAPAMVSGGAGLVPELAGNAGLFGVPAFRDTYKEQKAKGASESVAIEHALAAAGINTALPMIAPGGSKAVTKLLGAADMAGLKGAGVSLAQAAGEGAGFSVANSLAHKGIDVANGIQTDDPAIHWGELPSEALAFAALRGVHIAGHGAGSVASAIQQARSHRALIADIGRAGSVDEAIAAATAAVNVKPAADNVADVLQSIRPLEAKAPEAAAPALPTDALGRVEPTLGETSFEQIPAHAGMSEVANQGAIHEAAPAEGSDRGTGSVVAGRPGETVGERPAPAGTVPVGPEALDAVPGPQGGADPVRASAGGEPSPALGDGWHAFPPESGTLNIPRADMPQIKSEHRGAMTQFLNARGIAHEQVEIPADRLKPTQAEFSIDKVQKAHDFTGDGRSILVSSDGHVLDGHHQWLAAVEKGESVKAIRLDAPIRDLLEQVKEFPSATVSEGAPQRPGQDKLDDAAQRQQRQDEVVRLAAETIAARKATGGERARERVKEQNPFLHFLATHGISTKERSDTGAEKGRSSNPMVPGFGPVYRKSGLRLDELALAARDVGFLTEHDIAHPDDTGGTRKLSDLIQRAVHGKEVIRQASAVREPSADEQLRAEAEKLGIEINGKTPDQLYDEVVAEHAKDYTHDEAETVALAEQDADIPLDGGAPTNHLTDEEVDACFGIRTAGEAESRGREDQEGTASTARGADEGTGETGEGTRQRLKEIAGRLGVGVSEVGGGFNAAHGFVNIPAEDHVAEGALSPNHVFAHELGHAVMQKRGLSFKGFPKAELLKYIPDWDALVAASKEFRPAVWSHARDDVRRHARKPDEVIADAIGSVLLGNKPLTLLNGLMADGRITIYELGLKESQRAKGEDLLSGYTREEVLAREKSNEDRAKQRDAERAKLEAKRKKEADDKDVRARMDASADDFQLGQDAHDSLAGQKDIFSEPAPADKSPAPEPAAPDPLAEIPRAFLKKVKVEHEVYNAAEKRWDTETMPAHQALKSVREDISNLEAMLKCMKG